MIDAFDMYWGDRGITWNGKLDIKDYSRGVWDASKQYATTNIKAMECAVVCALQGETDYEGLPVSNLNYLQVIRKLRKKSNITGE